MAQSKNITTQTIWKIYGKKIVKHFFINNPNLSDQQNWDLIKSGRLFTLRFLHKFFVFNK